MNAGGKMNTEPSASAPIGKPPLHPDITNPKHQNMPEHRRCVAHKKNGARCQRPAMLGTTVCGHHGGLSPHVKRAARARLENAADRLARQLLGMAEDPDMAPAVKLAALRDALDRAGIGARTAMDVSVELKPYEKLFDRLDRSAGAGVGMETGPVVVDGEVVAEYADFSDGSTP
jgi:hypothetical protein